MKSINFFLSILIIFSGCNKYQKYKGNDTGIIVVDLAENQSIIDLKDITKNITFVQLETNRDCLLSGVSKVEFYNDKIFVYDSRYPGHLYCFDSQGKFLFKVGDSGQGPGEYISLLDFEIDIENKCLWLGDDARKILKYDFDGNFVEHYNTDFSIKNLCIIDAQESLMAIRLGYYKDNDFSFIIYSIKDREIIYHKKSNIVNIISAIGAKTFYKSEDQIIYTEPLNDTIFTVTKEGMRPYYVIDFGNRKLPKDLFDNPQLRNIITQINNPDNRYAGLVVNPNETANFLFFGYTYSGKGQIAIYSIETNKLINISKISFVGKIFENPKSFFHVQQGNKFISFLPAEQLISENASVKGNLQNGYGSYSDITEILPNLKEDDNHIMIIGEFDFDKLFPQ